MSVGSDTDFTNESTQDSDFHCQITPDLKSPDKGFWELLDPEGKRLVPKVGLLVNRSSSIFYSCKTNHKLVGESRRTCLYKDGQQWSGSSVECREDNGIPGLTNFQLALIIAITSAVVIIAVSATLLYCCVKEKRQKKKRRRRTHSQSRSVKRHNSGKYRINSNDDFSYSITHSTRQPSTFKTNSSFPSVTVALANQPHTDVPSTSQSDVNAQPGTSSSRSSYQFIDIIPTSTYLKANEEWKRNYYQQLQQNNTFSQNLMKQKKPIGRKIS